MSIDELARMIQERWAENDRSTRRWLGFCAVVMVVLAVVFIVDKFLT